MASRNTRSGAPKKPRAASSESSERPHAAHFRTGSELEKPKQGDALPVEVADALAEVSAKLRTLGINELQRYLSRELPSILRYDSSALGDESARLHLQLDLIQYKLQDNPDLRAEFERHALMDDYLRVRKNRSGIVAKGVGREPKQGASRKLQVFDGLPAIPPKLWPGGDRSKSKSENFAALVLFLNEVYAPHMHSHRAVLRKYILRHDRKCYRTIQDYERAGVELPENLQMPTVQEKLQQLLKRAVGEGLATLSKTEKRSVFRSAARKVRKPK